MGSVWDRLWEDFGALGASWAVLSAFFFMLVFGAVSKSALEYIWVGFWLEFEGFGKGFGRVLGRFW